MTLGRGLDLSLAENAKPVANARPAQCLDGQTDLVWQCLQDGWLAVWLMNGTTMLSSVPRTAGPMPGPGRRELIGMSSVRKPPSTIIKFSLRSSPKRSALIVFGAMRLSAWERRSSSRPRLARR